MLAGATAPASVVSWRGQVKASPSWCGARWRDDGDQTCWPAIQAAPMMPLSSPSAVRTISRARPGVGSAT